MVRLAGLIALVWLAGCATTAPIPVGEALSEARAADGRYVSWREHMIDGPLISGLPVTGGDGLIMADIDGDGRDDIVSVHESDVQYDGQPDGYVRIAFAGEGPDDWSNITVAEKTDAAAPEDVAAADFNGDGWLDLVVASELAHILYLQNPGPDARTAPWPRLILPVTVDRGSYIRVFAADLNGDGQPEAVAANKGAQNAGTVADPPPLPISVFALSGDPLDGASWSEHELARHLVPRQSCPVDIDGDGDMDVIGGSNREKRMYLFENTGGPGFDLAEIPMEIAGAESEGFNLAFADFNKDGRLDIVTASRRDLVWLEQPETLSETWTAHRIGSFDPDSMTGFTLADVDGDGDLDVYAGGYSRLGRERDDPNATAEDRLGRMGWFANPGDAAGTWTRHDVSRRIRGMFDMFVAVDLDRDGDTDFVGTRGNANTFDGVFWLEQVRSDEPARVFFPARPDDSREMPLPARDRAAE